MAVHAVRQIERPVLVALTVAGRSAIWIDLRTNSYVWDSDLESLPLHPETVQLRTRAISADDPGIEGPGNSLNPLLWMIGLNAFPGRATWLRAGDRYRLKARTDFTTLTMSPDETKLVKALTRGLMTVEQLGGRCGLPDSRAQRVVNALSLMDVLRRVEAPDAAPDLPPMTVTS